MMMTEKQMIQTIGVSLRSESNGLSYQGFRDSNVITSKAYVATLLYFANQVIRAIFNSGQKGRQATLTRAITLSRCLHRQGFMRAFMIVDQTPAIKFILYLGQIIKVMTGQYLCFQSA